MDKFDITSTKQKLHNINNLKYHIDGKQLYDSIEETNEKHTSVAEIENPNVMSNEKNTTSATELCAIEFVNLTYMEVQINLRFLGDLKEGEKIMITDGRFMHVDQRYIQTARRWWSDDSRAKTLHFISHLIESSKKYCADAVVKINKCDQKQNNKCDQKQNNLEKLINLQKLLGNALTGLGRLTATYGDDKLNIAMIETFKSTITVFCDHDLKKALV